MDDAGAISLVQDFLDVPIKRYPHGGLLVRAFDLRSSVTVYDGLYLAVAEALEALLITGDSALQERARPQAAVEVLALSLNYNLKFSGRKHRPPKEAIRVLKRRIFDVVYRRLFADAKTAKTMVVREDTQGRL